MASSPPITAPRTGPLPRFVDYLWTTQLGGWVDVARRHPSIASTAIISVVAATIYIGTSSREAQPLDYFVRLADGFLHGRLGVDEAPSWLNELIPAGPNLWYVPYPPMPAILLVPLVAIFGTGLHQQIVSSLLGGVTVGLAWLVLGQFALTVSRRFLLTLVFGFGTVLWYVAEVGSVWYFAHVVAVMFSLGAILLAMRQQWPFVAGLLLGCATTSRLPVGLTAPFILAMLVGVGWPPRVPAGWLESLRRTVLFGLGLALPVGLYALYNVARWGTPLDQGYVQIPGVLEDPIYAQHGILSIWYLPRHLYAIFLRSWNFVDDPPFLQPSWWGLSLFLTTPLFLWLGRARLRDPRVLWAVVGIALALIPIVTHGNIGISQFGYRFSLDVQPLLFVVLATAFERGMSRAAVLAALTSIAVCAYAIWAISIEFVAY
jgi:hypothetical protein